MANSGKKNGKQKGILARVGDLLTGNGKDEQDEKATKMLKEDHDRVRALFKRYGELGDRASREKQRIASEVSRELTIHMELEEKIFYPACMEGKKDAEKMIRESIEEHRVVKTLIAEIGRMSPGDGQYDAKFTVLKENVEHHADEEEDDLFPEAEDLMGDDELKRLGARMKRLKQRLQGSARQPTQSRGKTATPPRRQTTTTAARRQARVTRSDRSKQRRRAPAKG